VWLLSGAPDNSGEAISVEASIMAARESGLTSVVFISDACRSIPSGMQHSRVDGNSIFPNKPLNRNTRPEIDRLFATLPSLVAVEAASANDKARREGVFTRELIKGYLDPPTALIDQIAENGQLIEVVTNRKLKDRVRELVEDAAYEELPKAGQLPEFILESVQAYVGRVERAPPPPKSDHIALNIPGLEKMTGFAVKIGKQLERFDLRADRPSRGPPDRPKAPRRAAPAPSVATLARDIITAAVAGENSMQAANRIDRASGLAEVITQFSGTGPVDRFETETGFSVTGAQIARALSPRFPTYLLGMKDGLGVDPMNAGGPPSTSVLIEFEGGNGTVLPALRGFIGHIFVDQGVVVNVNYVPANNNWRWPEYERERERLESLRAAVAAAAALGVFRITPEEAQSFADKIRVLKGLDPTLGLYAAYAYASAGLDRQVKSVLAYMREDLNTELFDIAMLARRGVSPAETAAQTILPFCPMLRQGWSLLAVRDARLPDAVNAARDWLLPALWTTFAPEGVTILRDAIQRGDFT
jgi:hypothetical protein